MHKRDYFIKALAAGCYQHKRWILEAFSIVRQSKTEEAQPYPYRLVRNDQGQYSFLNPENDNQPEVLEGTTAGEPAFFFKEELALKVGEIPNLKKNIISTYGNLLFNQLVLVYAFGGKVEYVEGRIAVRDIEKIIEERLTDRPAEGQSEDPNALFVDEYKKFNEAMFSLAGLTQLCVPSASPKTMTTDPRIKVRRAELFEQYKDRLNDPVIQAKIGDELIAMDKAWIKGDSSEGYFIKGKSFNVVRKKLFIMQGAEEGFDVRGEVIPTSLSEGWDVKHLPAMSNSLREGSFSRGALTALGGEATKFNYRIFQNTTVAEEDCGSEYGLSVKLTKENVGFYLASSVITKAGPVELTEDNIARYIDRSVYIRSPIYCKSSGANFCATCIGKKIAQTPQAIGTYAADVGSMFMNIMLKKMHGSSLSIAKYNIKERIS